MYRRYLGRDELISQVLVYFALALACLMLVLWKRHRGSFDAEAIVYTVLFGLSTLMWVIRMGLFLYGNRHPLLDVGIDIERQTIHLLFGRRVLPWSEIKRFAYHRRHHLVRLYVGRGRVSFYLDQMKDDLGRPMDDETLQRLAQTTLVVAPKQLYNHPLTASGIAFVLFLVYAVVYGGYQVPIAGLPYLPSYYVLAGLTLIVTVVYGLDRLRLNRQVEGPTTNQDTSEN